MENILNVFYSFLTDYVKVWLILWGIMNFQLIANKKRIYLTLTAQTVLIIISALFYDEYQNEVMFFRIFLVVVAVSLILQGNFFKKLAYSLLAYIIALFLDGCVIGLSSLYANISGREFAQNQSIFINSFNILTFGIIAFLRKRKKFRFNVSKKIYALLFAGAATGIITLGGLMIRSNDAATETVRRLMLIVTIIVVIAYNAACLMIAIITESRDNYKALSVINQNVIESQQQYYTLVNEKQQEIRAIRHDMKHHLACLYSLYQSKEFDEIGTYISQLIEASKTTGELFNTGNDIVNAILNDAQNKYAKENISLNLKGAFPEELHIASTDLCVIFANLVSNAVEAIQGAERIADEMSYIDIKISNYKDDLFIDIINPVSKNVEFRNGSLSTSKDDKSSHGFGVKNVIQCVKKYNGSAEFKCENNEFLVQIDMKNKA